MRRLTDVGGQFPAWSHDGKLVHWSLGNAHTRYDLAAADSVARITPDSGTKAPTSVTL